MSILAKLSPAEGSTHYKKRVGRGIGSGMGGTSTKGHKGQIARSGGRVRRGFEGGQTPLSRRLPKFGFSNKAFENHFEIVNLDTLENSNLSEITPEALFNAGIISKGKVKVLGNGKISKPLTLKVHKVSESAKAAIEKAGGSVELI